MGIFWLFDGKKKQNLLGGAPAWLQPKTGARRFTHWITISLLQCCRTNKQLKTHLSEKRVDTSKASHTDRSQTKIRTIKLISETGRIPLWASTVFPPSAVKVFRLVNTDGQLHLLALINHIPLSHYLCAVEVIRFHTWLFLPLMFIQVQKNENVALNSVSWGSVFILDPIQICFCLKQFGWFEFKCVCSQTFSFSPSYSVFLRVCVCFANWGPFQV